MGPSYSPIPLRYEDVQYHGESEWLYACIRKFLQTVPGDVARFAIRRCVFISVGKVSRGITLPARIAADEFSRRTRNMWLIVLDERIGQKEVLALIAHEVAHAFLKHDRLSPEMPESCEVDAALLAKSWGFSGKGTDPEFCNR